MPSPPRNHPHQPRSIISNVLGYFEREYDKFVATATGTPLPDVAPDTVANDDDKVADTTSLAAELERATRGWAYAGTKRSADHSPERRNRARRHEASTSTPSHERDANKHYTRTSTYDRQVDALPRDQASASTSDERRSATTSNGFGVRRQRRLSVTMPGSLFPRSESLEPEDTTPAMPQMTRRVSFATTPLELSRRHHSEGDGIPRPIPFGESELEADDVSSEQASPLLCRGAPVKVAASLNDGSFCSIMLPNHIASPSSVASRRSPSRSPAQIVAQSQGMQTSAEEASPPRKGKGKAVDDPFLDMDPNISGVIRFRGKQKELDDAREEFLRNERVMEREGNNFDGDDAQRNDKLKIRMLEQEIEKLKAELAKRPTHVPAATETSVLATPIPPAPPPPPPATYTTPKPIRDPHMGKDTVLNAVRASLRHAGTPIEAPINDPLIPPGVRMKRTGQPTVKLANDQMASFLSEIKSVKLKRVGDASFANASTILDARPALGHAPSLRRRATVDDLNSKAHEDLTRRRSTTDLVNATIDQLPPTRRLDKGKRRAVDTGNVTVGYIPLSRPQVQAEPSRLDRPAVDPAPARVQEKPTTIVKPVAEKPVARHPPIATAAQSSSQSLSSSTAVTQPGAVTRTQRRKAPDYGNLTVGHAAPPRRSSPIEVDRANVTLDQAVVGGKRKRPADESTSDHRDARRRHPFALEPPISKPGSKAIEKPARVVAAAKPHSSTILHASVKGGPLRGAPRLYPMPPPITAAVPAPQVRATTSNANTDLTPSLTSDHEASPEPVDRLATPPVPTRVHRAVPHLDLLKLAGHSGAKGESLPMQSTVPRHPRGSKRLSGGGNGFASRMPQSPILITTPRRPLPPARRSVSQQSRTASAGVPVTPDGLAYDDRFQLRRPARLSGDLPEPTYRHPSPLNTLGLESFPSDDLMNDSKSIPATLSRRKSAGSLVEEFMHGPSSGEYDNLGMDSGVFVGLGTKSKRRGFLAHGGAGGPSVFMGKGYIDGAVDSDEEAAELEAQYRAQVMASQPARRTRPKANGR